MTHEQSQQKFYNHLRMHPGAHQAASSFAKKIVAKDPQAVACLKDLAARAATDERAANALRIVAVTMKYEQPSSIIAGALPAIHTAGGKIIKLVLTPAGWVLNAGGKGFSWAGSQLQHLSHAI